MPGAGDRTTTSKITTTSILKWSKNHFFFVDGVQRAYETGVRATPGIERWKSRGDFPIWLAERTPNPECHGSWGIACWIRRKQSTARSLAVAGCWSTNKYFVQSKFEVSSFTQSVHHGHPFTTRNPSSLWKQVWCFDFNPSLERLIIFSSKLYTRFIFQLFIDHPSRIGG